MNFIELYKVILKWSQSTLQHLQFYRNCKISISCKSLYLQVTAEVSKITKSRQCNLNFIFIELSEAASSFAQILLVLEIKKVATFIKTRFHCKQDSIKMRKHVETFNANKGCKLAIVVFIPTSQFSKQKFVVHVIFIKMRLCTLLPFI